MSFIDKVNITVIAGNGGDGKRSFRHERYIAKGGPDGGDGGDGGDIVFVASDNQNTLAAFRYKKQLTAPDGKPGDTSRKHGRSGEDLLVKVPVGTEITLGGRVITDLIVSGQNEIMAVGGRGGFGNAHFTSSTRQAPNFAEKGEKGEKLDLTLELKLIADVGLVGLPNAGKSTLLSRLSNARPEIADYPFTTLTPNLGVVDIDNTSSILIADIPGLIEGAAEGKGLGHEFLKHIERTRLVVHLIDIYGDIELSYKTIRNELKAYSPKLAKLPEVVVLNKIDGINEDFLNEKTAQLQEILPKKTKVYLISAQAGTNLNELKFTLKNTLDAIKPKKPKKEKDALPRITLEDKSSAYVITKVDDGYRIEGEKIEKFADRTDFNNEEAQDRFKNILKRMGILHELIRSGLESGDQIYIGESSFTF
jgi:GTP-binding protein